MENDRYRGLIQRALDDLYAAVSIPSNRGLPSDLFVKSEQWPGMLVSIPSNRGLPSDLGPVFRYRRKNQVSIPSNRGLPSDNAIDELAAQTSPETPMPRLRRFVIVPGRIIWPDGGDPKGVSLPARRDSDRVWLMAPTVMRHCRTPRDVFRALQRIRSITAWCRARREGRLRAAQEILKQQQRYVEALKAEIALEALGKM